MDSLIYERDKDNFSTVRDELFEISGLDYKPDGLTIFCDIDRDVPEVRGYKKISRIWACLIFFEVGIVGHTRLQKMQELETIFFFI